MFCVLWGLYGCILTNAKVINLKNNYLPSNYQARQATTDLAEI